LLSKAAPDTEWALLIDCTAPQLSLETRQRALHQLAAGVDEGRLYALAQAQQMTMLLYRGLLSLNADLPLRDRLDAEMTGQAVLYEFVYPQQLEAVLSALHAAGVETLVLKGHALGQMIFRQPVLRPYSDFDILVLPDKLEQAAIVLKEMGFFPDSDPAFTPDYHLNHHHIVPYLHTEWLPVEVHWRLVSGPAQVDMDAVWAGAQPMVVGNVGTLALLPEHLLIYLALHAAMHLFDMGLRALADVNEVMAVCSLDWDQVVRTSREWRCARQVYVLLRMVCALYGADRVPERVLHDLCAEGIEPELLGYCLSNMRETAVGGLKQSSGLAEVWLTGSPARRWRSMVKRLFAPSAEVAAAYGLAAGNWRRWLLYPRWQAALIQRHLPSLSGLVRADPTVVEKARQETIRRDLLAWMENKHD
jgi:hypothetical protein